MGGSMSSVVISGDTSGAITLAAPAVSGTNTVTIAAQTGTLNVAGPAFSAYQSSSQTISTTFVKIQFQSETFDTNNNFDSSTNYRFTPTVAGYYYVNAQLFSSSSSALLQLAIYKNGSVAQYGVYLASISQTSGLFYMNGSTDYLEIYGYQSASNALSTGADKTFFQSYLVRGA